MAKDIYTSLGSVNSNTRPRRHLQPEPDMGAKKTSGGSSYGMGNLGGTSNKKTRGRYKGLA